LIEHRLLAEIENGRKHMLLAGLLNATAMLEVFKGTIGRQGSAGANHGTLNRLIVLDRVEEISGKQLSRIDGRGVQFQRDATPVIDALTA
jgi:hypothetical protein